MTTPHCLVVPILVFGCFANSASAAAEDWQERMREANRLDREGRYAEAQKLYLAALEEAEKSGPADPRLAESLNNLAAHYFHTGKYAQAEPVYRRAIASWKTSRGDANRDLALTMNNLAALYRAQGRYSLAAPL